MAQQQYLNLFWANTASVYVALQDVFIFILLENHWEWEKYDDEISVI